MAPAKPHLLVVALRALIWLACWPGCGSGAVGGGETPSDPAKVNGSVELEETAGEQAKFSLWKTEASSPEVHGKQTLSISVVARNDGETTLGDGRLRIEAVAPSGKTVTSAAEGVHIEAGTETLVAHQLGPFDEEGDWLFRAQLQDLSGALLSAGPNNEVTVRVILDYRISLKALGTYGGSSQGQKMSATNNPGPYTFLSPQEHRYFALFFVPAEYTVDGAGIIITISDPQGIGGPSLNGGTLKYDQDNQAWYEAGSGAYLRVWKNEHTFSCRYPTGRLTYAGKTGGPPEITCGCDADLDPVTGLSKTRPAGLHGSMPAVDASRWYLEGDEVVVVAD